MFSAASRIEIYVTSEGSVAVHAAVPPNNHDEDAPSKIKGKVMTFSPTDGTFKVDGTPVSAAY